MAYLENASEETVLLLLADGNEQAFRFIFHKYVDRIHQVSLYYLRSEVLAEEVVQEVFMRVWIKRTDLRQVHHFEGWLFIMSKNYILNYLEKMAGERRALHTLSRSIQQSEDRTALSIADHEYEALLHKALLTLSPMQRDIYHMAREEQLTYDQIGKKLGISALTVKTHMSRALRQLRHFFRHHGISLRLFFSCLLP
jgi:RNA polymerase sigma-70 factor (ECF subfamily)